jgi:hypothetical protein
MRIIRAKLNNPERNSLNKLNILKFAEQSPFRMIPFLKQNQILSYSLFFYFKTA